MILTTCIGKYRGYTEEETQSDEISKYISLLDSSKDKESIKVGDNV